MNRPDKRAELIVKKVRSLYSEQLPVSKGDVVNCIVLHNPTDIIQRLILEFETITGQNWDQTANSYLE